jgi:uncharacterized protein (DUF3084 family)
MTEPTMRNIKDRILEEATKVDGVAEDEKAVRSEVGEHTNEAKSISEDLTALLGRFAALKTSVTATKEKHDKAVEDTTNIITAVRHLGDGSDPLEEQASGQLQGSLKAMTGGDEGAGVGQALHNVSNTLAQQEVIATTLSTQVEQMSGYLATAGGVLEGVDTSLRGGATSLREWVAVA